MNRKIIHLVMAARPNIMKIAPLYHALFKQPWAEPILVHTGQHYDDAMSGVFLRDFDLPAPHHHLEIGSGTHAEQTGRTMIAYESLCKVLRPDLCVVAGDVNATLACTVSAKKLNIPVAHLEAGLRSHDRSMPEEINRLATDAICDWHWTPSYDASTHLVREGVPPEKIREIGNIMIDAYCMVKDRVAADSTYETMGLRDEVYAVVTFHRPSNVDEPKSLDKIINTITSIAADTPVVFPLHPRTARKLDDTGGMERLAACKGVHICDPLSYIKFMNLVTHARLVITDSGGVQEETSYLGIPCLTLRETTERPITISEGTNRLIGFDGLLAAIRDALKEPLPKRPVIKGWDGQAAKRTVDHISEILKTGSETQTRRLAVANSVASSFQISAKRSHKQR